MEPNCVSYNFNKKEAANGQHKCDLNSATYEHDNEHSGDLAKNEIMCIVELRILVRRHLVRTTQPARPVLQTEITSVCVFSDLLAMTVERM